MTSNHSRDLRRHVIPLLQATYWSAVDAPKTPTDDLMLELCDALLVTAPEQARQFYANPLGGPSGDPSEFATVVREDSHTCFRQYSGRALWLSLEEHSPRRLLSGLLTYALSRREERDWRDLLVALAPYHHCAQVLGADVAELFDQTGRYAAPAMAEHYRTFGRRRDVTLGAFGWVEVETPHGVRFRPSYRP